jgi:hypothetical protein
VDYTDPDFWQKLMPAAVVAQHSSANLAHEEYSLEHGRHRFSKVLSAVFFHSTCTRALIFENFPRARQAQILKSALYGALL